MAINASVQYNGGLLPDILLLTQYYYHWGTMKMFSLCSLMIPSKRFDICFPLCEMLRRSRCVLIFLSLRTWHVPVLQGIIVSSKAL